MKIVSMSIMALVLICQVIWAKGEENLVYESMIKTFHQSVEKYNNEKLKTSPEIVFNQTGIYKIDYKVAHIEFTITDVFQNKFTVNGKTAKWTNFLKGSAKKTSFINLLNNLNPVAIANAGYDDTEMQDFSQLKMDGDSTKILLNTLGDFTKNLESISVISFDPCITATCIRTRREKNIAKLLNTANQRTEECQKLQAAQVESIDRAKSYKQGEWLISINDYEFRAVKEFFEKMSKKKSKDAVSFLETAMAYKDHAYSNCMGIILSGTLADGMADTMDLGKSALGAYGSGSLYKVELANSAGKVCEKFEELKDCLKDVKENVSRINTLKRSIKKQDGSMMPIDTVPSSSVLNK